MDSIKQVPKSEYGFSRIYGYIGHLQDSLSECEAELLFEPKVDLEIINQLREIAYKVEDVNYNIDKLRRYLKI